MIDKEYLWRKIMSMIPFSMLPHFFQTSTAGESPGIPDAGYDLPDSNPQAQLDRQIGEPCKDTWLAPYFAVETTHFLLFSLILRNKKGKMEITSSFALVMGIVSH
jgi:hypothetical protein